MQCPNHRDVAIELEDGVYRTHTFDPADRVSQEQKRRVFETGVLPEGIGAPPGVVTDSVGDEREEAEGLRSAIAYYLASPGPAIPHRILGPLTREEWDRFELIHLAHHLSFAVPC